ncbi:MAG: helix-turn-helix transcriptional regulator [Oscillospiraceae bacterium]|nr:helix-turn-helix transcriptional regulator [Clostridia bacterium]MDD6023510.1 helix-turn-helix transcriptional regulator [Oscillospiraceae bacterium]
MAIDNIAIGQRIHHFRKKKGLSQMALAERVDISPTYMSYLETGIRSMGVETLVRLANALNVCQAVAHEATERREKLQHDYQHSRSCKTGFSNGI